MLATGICSRSAPFDTTNAAFEIELASTGEVIHVRRGQSALEALVENDVVIPVSCSDGTCGACVTRVLDGAPVHRDAFLSEAEHAANDAFTPCCSRGVRRLVIDI